MSWNPKCPRATGRAARSRRRARRATSRPAGTPKASRRLLVDGDQRTSRRSSSADASSNIPRFRSASSARRRAMTPSSERNGRLAATNRPTDFVRLMPPAARRRARSSVRAAAAFRRSRGHPIRKRPGRRRATRRGRGRRFGTPRGRRPGPRSGHPALPAPQCRNGGRRATGDLAWHRGSQGLDRSRLARGSNPFELAAIETAVAAEAQERLDSALVSPAPQRVGMNAEHLAGGPQRQPSGRRRIGRRRHGDDNLTG